MQISSRLESALVFVVALICAVAFGLIPAKKVDAHTSITHLLCQTKSSESDIIQAQIELHRAPLIVPTGAYDRYPFDDNSPPGPDPFAAEWAAPNDNQLYAIISQPPLGNYRPEQRVAESGNMVCNYNLVCKSTCDRPIVSGTCDNSCNVTFTENSCPRYGGNQLFTVDTGNNVTFIDWGDGKPIEGITPNPLPVQTFHSYTYPGKYDIRVQCQNQPGCHKRYHVVCQPGGSGGGSTPTPYPTTTPTPTNWPSVCAEGLQCSHPCACNSGSLQFANAGCTGDLAADLAGSNVSAGYGSSTGSLAGQICAPGLICCEAPDPVSSGAWMKTKDASFHKQSLLTNDIPSNATEFDGDDVGACDSQSPGSLACHTISSGGLVSAEGATGYGDGVANYLSWSYGDGGYAFTSEISPNSFIQFSLAQKDIVTISNPSEVQANKINYLTGDHTIDSDVETAMNSNYPFVLIVDNGNLTFDLDTTFNASKFGAAFIVDGTINIKSSMTEANGVFIANRIDFAYDTSEGDTTTNELKISGNVVSQTAVNCADKRQRTDSTKPSCFFAFDFVNQYVPLLKLLSTRTFSRSTY